jgi:hypothetical protein
VGRLLLDTRVLIDVRSRLVTGNPKDFPMPELEVEHWPVGL